MRRLPGISFLLAALFPAAALAQPSPPPACAASALKPIVATHAIPPYPTISQRLGEQGTVSMRLTIMPDGSVGAVSVVKSSGSLRLDDAATQFIQENWRWQPFDKNCAPAIVTQVNFVWDLKSTQQGPPPYAVIDLGIADYPPDARAKQEQGISTVAVQLSETGAIIGVRIISSSNFTDLDNKALDIARTRWQWAPAQMAGKPVPSVVFVALRWPALVGAPQAPPKP